MDTLANLEGIETDGDDRPKRVSRFFLAQPFLASALCFLFAFFFPTNKLVSSSRQTVKIVDVTVFQDPYQEVEDEKAQAAAKAAAAEDASASLEPNIPAVSRRCASKGGRAVEYGWRSSFRRW